MRDPATYRSARRNQARDERSPTMLKYRAPPRFNNRQRRRAAAVARLAVQK